MAGRPGNESREGSACYEGVARCTASRTRARVGDGCPPHKSRARARPRRQGGGTLRDVFVRARVLGVGPAGVRVVWKVAALSAAWYNGEDDARRDEARTRRPEEAARFNQASEIDEWEMLPPTVRDPMAARAWVAEWGDVTRALVRLGFPSMNRLPPGKVRLYKHYADCVFGTPGVQAILKRDLSRLDAEREAILSRQLQTALYGEDAESVRAAALLTKVCGWEYRGNPTAVSAATVEP